eukprot:jgi/Chlat1/1543/Chrsp122S08667
MALRCLPVQTAVAMDLSTAVSLQAGGGQRRQQHSSRGLTFQAPTAGIKAVGSSGWSSNKHAQRLSLSAAQYDTAVTEDEAQDQGVVGEQQEDFGASKSDDKLTAESVMVEVEKTQRNGRQLQATIKVAAPLRSVWSCLTDYANLAEFIPSLAQNTVLQERSDGARLEQASMTCIIALGIKFRARVIVDVQESAPATEDGNHDIRFDMIEGDFQEFSGVWSMEQDLSSGEKHTLLKYSVLVRPQRWLPVALVEGRIKRDMQTNLVAVAAEAVARARNSDGVRVA